MKKIVLSKTLLFMVVFMSLGAFSKNINSDVDFSEKLKVQQKLFVAQGQTQSPEKVSSFAWLEDKFFKIQVKNISAVEISGSDEIGKANAFGHAPKEL